MRGRDWFVLGVLVGAFVMDSWWQRLVDDLDEVRAAGGYEWRPTATG